MAQDDDDVIVIQTDEDRWVEKWGNGVSASTMLALLRKLEPTDDTDKSYMGECFNFHTLYNNF